MKKIIYGILFFVSFIVLFGIIGSYEQDVIRIKSLTLLTIICLIVALISACKLEILTIPDDVKGGRQ